MKNGSKIDLSAIDFRSLTPDEWEFVKQQIIAQARQDRADVIRGVVLAMYVWLRTRIAAAWKEIFSGDHPVFPTRRA